MNSILIFVLLSIPVVAFSWRSLRSVKSHGFFRFFGWEGLLWIAVSNAPYWFDDPLDTLQVISWLLLFTSLVLVVTGAVEMHRRGNASPQRNDNSLFGFEKTTALVDTGIFGYIRHPLYSSLIWLTWGLLFKHVTMPLLIVAVVSSLLFVLTALRDEKECIAYFGSSYSDYMKRTKRFVPFII